MASPDLFYETHIFCCVNERPEGHVRGCCMERGAVKLRNYMKARLKELGIEKTRVNNAGCLDRCELGPAMVIYPEGVWYHYKTTEDIEEIIDLHIKQGRKVDRLLLNVDQQELRPDQLADEVE